MTPSTPAWAEISLSALRHNFKALSTLAKGSQVLPVVKANAYGHGAVPAAKAFIQAGAKFLAVAFVQEGVALRDAGIQTPILVLTPTLPPEIPALLENGLIPQISSVEGAKALSIAAQKMRIPEVPVHLKIDTGMARVGFSPASILQEVQAVRKVPRIKIEALYTHLATADWTDPVYAWKQITLFRQSVEKVQQALGVHFETHVANSAALIIYYPQSKGTWVRPGIALYGVYPHPSMKKKVRLMPVMQVRTKVLHVKELEKGESISYGRTFTAPKKMKVATIAMGYADGLLRSLSNQGKCLIKGKKVSFVGRVCMDMTMVDVSGISVKTGDVATIFGKDGKAFLPVEEQAAYAGTIPYELFCAVGPRISRFYSN